MTKGVKIMSDAITAVLLWGVGLSRGMHRDGRILRCQVNGLHANQIQ